uniref:Protein kinase domain-containing protein n=1 Tax=Leersia perrieri TaxID=77586 RepID=A0A0D9XT50_9ORYZ
MEGNVAIAAAAGGQGEDLRRRLPPPPHAVRRESVAPPPTAATIPFDSRLIWKERMIGSSTIDRFRQPSGSVILKMSFLLRLLNQSNLLQDLGEELELPTLIDGELHRSEIHPPACCADSCWYKLEFLENMCAVRDIRDNNNDDIRNFTEDEIETITSSYSTLIGKGGFGEVYRGVLDNDDLVAVKRYIRGDLIQEFMEEVRIHSQIDHKNVVKLIGYCRGEDTLVMVTEYISEGNLEDILHNRKVAMPLDTRLGIAIGCAKALNYMHSMHLSTDSLVCHGDIKPANILLDDNLTAKLSDFGVSRLLLGGTTRHTVNVKGSIDYMDPMYRRDGCLTSKNDVYSFGIVLMELISRKRVNEGKASLIYTFEAFFQGRVPLMEVFDGEIVNEGNLEALESIGKLANKCADWNIKNRPKMSVVVEQLLKLWESLRGGQGLLKMSLAVFKRITLNSTIQTKLQNTKVEAFSAGKLVRVTQNYSCLLGEDSFHEYYKGTLEDNTLVAVATYKLLPTVAFIHPVMIMSQIVHKNIIKLLGYCFEDYCPILVFEYAFASERCLTDILHGNKDHLPLELRLKIAVQTAEALAYIQSPSTGVSHHDTAVPSNIILDDNLIPKVTGYLLLLERKKMFKDMADYVHYMDPESVKSAVYSFGIVLMELISRKKPVYDKGCRLIDKFITDNSRKEMFDKDILSEDSFVVLEGIGQLAVKCTSKLVDKRPTMKQVAEYLEITRRHWKKHIAERARSATSCSEAEAAIAVGISGDEASELMTIMTSEISVKMRLKQLLAAIPLSSAKVALGEVYRGVLDNDDLVAVKRYIRGDLIQEFMEAVRIHSQINHKNIVKLIGYYEYLTTKISDFGLSRLLSDGCLTPRSDVYSFGVVLLELITRKRLRELFDDEIVNEGNMEALETIGKSANKCLTSRKHSAWKQRSSLAGIVSEDCSLDCTSISIHPITRNWSQRPPSYGSVSTSNIILDDNFNPKVTGYMAKWTGLTD